MSDQINAQPTESAPASTPVPAAPSGEVQQTATPSSEPAAQTPPSASAEKPVWDGKLESLKNPEDIERGKAMQRYLTKKTQELTEFKKRAEEYETFKTSADYQQYQQWLNAQRFNQPSPVANTPNTQNTNNGVPPEAWEQMGIDPNAAKLVEQVLETKLAEKEKYFQDELNRIRTEQIKRLKIEEIQSFAEANPNFNKYLEDEIASPAFQFLLEKDGKSLEEAYEIVDNYMSKLEHTASEKAQAAAQARVQEKKSAVAASPSVNVDSEYVEVANEAESRDMAFKLALRNDPRKVRIRKK